MTHALTISGASATVDVDDDTPLLCEISRPSYAIRPDDSTHSPSATPASPGRIPPLLGAIAYAPRPRGSFVRW